MNSDRLAASRPEVLVVDDEDFFSSFLREKFGDLGYVVKTAADAREALALVGARACPRVILLDLMMPRLGGEGLLRELARSSRASEIRVVLVSAHHTVERVAAGHPLVVGRMQKPVDVGELARLVGRAAADLVASHTGN